MPQIFEDALVQLARIDLLLQAHRFVEHEQNVPVADGVPHLRQKFILKRRAPVLQELGAFQRRQFDLMLFAQRPHDRVGEVPQEPVDAVDGEAVQIDEDAQIT